MEKVLFVDPEKCTGCKVCEFICSLHHENEINPIKSRIQVISWEREGIEVPMVCQQCEDPPCEAACPTHAIYRDPQTGAMLIKEEACIGCRMCINVCPFGGSSIHPDTRKVIKCDLCQGEPECVEFCATKALEYITVSKAVLLRKRAAAQKLGELFKTLAITSAS